MDRHNDFWLTCTMTFYATFMYIFNSQLNFRSNKILFLILPYIVIEFQSFIHHLEPKKKNKITQT